MVAVGRFSILWVAALLALFTAGTVGTARAQSPVAIGAPLEGPVVLNRDVEVRIGPNQDARIIMTMKSGRAVNALGTPRGTTWTQVAIGGQPVGYVPADSLDPVYVPRPVPVAPPPPKAEAADKGGKTAPDLPRRGVGALVPRAAWEAAAPAPMAGYVVATRAVRATEVLDARKRVGFTLKKGHVVALAGIEQGRAELSVPGRGKVVADLDGFLGVASPYPLPGEPALPSGPVYAVKLGEYLSYAEGLRAWGEFTGGPGTQYRERPAMVWPVFREGRVNWTMAIGPFSRLQIDTACSTLAQRGRDCSVIELEAF
ncbi:SH3 domain-containing protein [Azospirillum sp. TSO22-1]|uniref:SH3 domain-containing protein n=1 Tax=Azospirillum sp. TSO22-1 TaxID=716789 RepID=UPI001FFED6B5|nr:SH3 domain-containing protein [Azospirillum sp. TSO22-1]